MACSESGTRMKINANTRTIPVLEYGDTVRYRNAQLPDWVEETPVRNRNAQVPDWVEGWRNADASGIGLDAIAQLCLHPCIF